MNTILKDESWPGIFKTSKTIRSHLAAFKHEDVQTEIGYALSLYHASFDMTFTERRSRVSTYALKYLLKGPTRLLEESLLSQ